MSAEGPATGFAWKRRLLHIGAGLAVALFVHGHLAPELASGTRMGWLIGLCALFTVMNGVLLPRLGVARRGREASFADVGLWSFPATLGLLALALWIDGTRSALLMATLVLAVGDGLGPVFAHLGVAGPRWPGASQRRVLPSLLAGICTAGLASLAFQLPWPIVAAGCVGFLVVEARWPKAWDDNPGHVLVAGACALPYAVAEDARLGVLGALAIALALGCLLKRRGTVDLGGAVAGAAATFVLLRGAARAHEAGLGAFAAWAPFAGFCALVVLGTGVSKLGLARKQSLGVAQEQGGVRDLLHVGANVGVGVLAFAWGLGAGLDATDAQLALAASTGLLVALGAFGAALADTVAGEVGMLGSAQPRWLAFGPRVPIGTDGATSALGNLAGLIIALLFAALGALAVPSAPALAAAAVALGALAGLLMDTLVGALIEPHLKHPRANEMVNLSATATAALCTYAGVQAFGIASGG